MSNDGLIIALERDRDILCARATALREERDALRAALADLVARCDGDEGVRADGSNIQTMAAHAVLAALEVSHG